MKTVSIKISDFEYNQLGLTETSLSFSDLLEIISKKITKQALEKSVRLASKYGLSDMSLDEVNEEVEAYRKCKK